MPAGGLLTGGTATSSRTIHPAASNPAMPPQAANLHLRGKIAGSSVTGSRPGPHERRFLDCVARSAPTKAVCRHLLRAATAERLLGAAQSRSPRAFDQVHSPLRGTVRPSDALTPSGGKNEANNDTTRPASRFCTSILVHHNQSSGARPNIAKAVNRPKL